MTMRGIVYTLPPPLPREGGRMPPHRTRMPLSRIRHFERKREIFFVRGKAKAVRGAGNGKHPAPGKSGSRCFMQTVPRRKRNTANEKDPSAALGMTIREYRSPARLSSLCDANLRPFGAPPSKGRRENAAPPHSSLIPVSSLVYKSVSSPQPDASALLPRGNRSDQSRAGGAWRAGRGSGRRLRIPNPWPPAS